MTKPEYIKRLEYSSEIFLSDLMVCDKYPIKNIDESKLQLVWNHLELDEDKIISYDRIYRTNHGFYIYIVRNRINKNECSINVYFDPQKIEELKFFIKPFLNSLKK